MIRVLVIIPYPELYAMAEQAVADTRRHGIECTLIHAYGTGLKTMPLDDVDIVLARGLTHQAIKNRYPRLTVLEFTISAYDILRAIHDCRRHFNAGKIAVIGSASILYDVETIKQLVDADMDIFPIVDEPGIVTALETARRRGFDAVVGGLTACTLAKERGWRTTFIRTSAETLQIAIKETINTATVMLRERAEAELLRSMLENSKEAVLYFDNAGHLVHHNHRVFQVLGIPAGTRLAGSPVESVLDDKELAGLVRECGETQGMLKSVGSALAVFHTVPVRMGGEAIGVICTAQSADEIQAAESSIRTKLSQKGLVARYGFDHIIHASPTIAQTIATARKYAGADANVLLIGETGTGKELFAQSIHNASTRAARPFVAVNCASFPESLLESELYGYVEGAFSGAVKGGKTGLFELAHGGTLFLDEVGEIPLKLQATLLRALQEGEIRRIGDDKVIPVNVRIVAATNEDLRSRAAAGEFRMDLLYRLDVLSLSLPPLRQRREDVILIATSYMKRFRAQYAKPGVILSPAAKKALTAYDWPGNIRELRNVCERLVVLGDRGQGITGEDVAAILPRTGDSPAGVWPEKTAAAQEMADGERSMFEQFLAMRMNKTDLAELLGMSRTTLWRRLNQHKARKTRQS